MRLPAKLTTYIPSRWGDDGRAWLRRLPATVASLRHDWNLGPLRPADDSNRSYVAATVVGDRPVWLKVDCDPEWQAAADTLAVWADGQVGPSVLARCDRRQATLLSDVGRPLDRPSVARSDAVGRLLAAAHRLPAPATVACRTGAGAASVDVARARLARLYDPPYDPALLDRALPTPTSAPVLRHGDLTARNVCVDGDRLALIDPDPRVGPPELDTVQWALRADDGRHWRDHLDAVSGGTYDRCYVAALAPHMARTYVAYLLATGRPVPDTHLALARRPTVEL